MTHPYLWNRSPAWVTTWSRGIGPSTATLRPGRPFSSFITTPPAPVGIAPRDVRPVAPWGPAGCADLRPAPGAQRTCLSGPRELRCRRARCEPRSGPVPAEQDLREAFRGFLACPVLLELTPHLGHAGRLAAGLSDAVQPAWCAPDGLACHGSALPCFHNR